MTSQYIVKNSQRTFMYLYRLETKFQKPGTCIRNRSQTSISTSALFWNAADKSRSVISRFSKIVSSTRLVLCSRPSLICWDDRRHLYCGCYVRPFSNPLRHFVTCRTLVTSSSYTFINRQWTSRRKTRFTHKKRNHSTYLFAGTKVTSYQFTPRMASDCCAICCTLYLLSVLPSTQKLNASIT